eukprot:1157340-Pelagomonas_calceolata.AAC.6
MHRRPSLWWIPGIGSPQSLCMHEARSGPASRIGVGQSQGNPNAGPKRKSARCEATRLLTAEGLNIGLTISS